MDSVYSLYNAISSAKVDIGKYFEAYHKLISDDRSNENHDGGDNSIASFMPSSLDEEELDMLAEYCSVDKLTVPNELPKYETTTASKKGQWSIECTEIPKETGLATLEHLQLMYKTRSGENMKKFRKYTGEIAIRYNKAETEGPTAVPGKDSVIFIKVYEPFGTRNTAICGSGKKIVMSSMIAILGSQTLDKVRDLIDCVSDLSISTEVSENPEKPMEPVAKDIYKSGFFYIEGTFYNDFRDSGNEDNSEVIREWVKTHNLGPFETATMENTRVDSLSVRFGFPWVYQHQGSCEHLIVFSDARLLNIDDELAVSAYPRIHRLKQRRIRYCMMCGVLPARWVTTDSDRIPHNPCYVCETCFKSYNYVDGKKIGKFKAYRYPHHPDLMQDKPSSPETEESSGSKGNSNTPKKRCKT